MSLKQTIDPPQNFLGLLRWRATHLVCKRSIGCADPRFEHHFDIFAQFTGGF